jgi:hypothetical protein
MSRTTREVTVKLLDLMDEGALDPRALAAACLNYMSEAEVADMARVNDILVEDEEDGWLHEAPCTVCGDMIPAGEGSCSDHEK